MSTSSWKFFTGNPYKWDKTTGNFTVNRKSIILPFAINFLNFLGVTWHLLYSMYLEQETDTQGLASLDIFVASDIIFGSLFIAFFCSCILLDPKGVEDFNKAVAQFELKNICDEEDSWKMRLKKRRMTKLAIFTCQWIRISAAQMLPFIVGIGAILAPELPFNFLIYYPGKVFVLGSEAIIGHLRSTTLQSFIRGSTLFLGNVLIWKFPTKYWSLCFTQIAVDCTGLCNAVLQSER